MQHSAVVKLGTKGQLDDGVERKSSPVIWQREIHGDMAWERRCFRGRRLLRQSAAADVQNGRADFFLRDFDADETGGPSSLETFRPTTDFRRDRCQFFPRQRGLGRDADERAFETAELVRLPVR